MNKFSKDSEILNLQNQLAIAKQFEREAIEEGKEDSIILMYMEQVDHLTDLLLDKGCHIRDCR